MRLRTAMLSALTSAVMLTALAMPPLAEAATTPTGIVKVAVVGGAVENVRPAFNNCTVDNPGGDIAITPGSTIVDGEAFCSGAYELILQTDGNMVIYNASGSLWYSGTAYGTDRAVMQTDGNFVIYSPTNVALWNTHTWSNPGAYVCIQTDGNLVVYAYNGGSYTCTGHALWDSNT